MLRMQHAILATISVVVATSMMTLFAIGNDNRVDQRKILAEATMKTSSILPSESSSISSSEFSSESSSELSSESVSSEDSSVAEAEPAPAPEQEITGNVINDPKFEQTEEDKKEDPEAGKEDAGPGGSITVPNTPPTQPTEPSSSAPSSSESSSSGEGSTTEQPGPGYNGWWSSNGKNYCYVNGQKLVGWYNVGGIGYYFDAEGAVSSKVGIDVSQHQGTINWNAVKADGIQFAMIRVGYRGNQSGKIVMDSQFETNVRNALAAGIEVGIYFFSQAINVDEARAEAEFSLNAAQNAGVTGPIVIDTEYVAWNPAVDGEPRANRISTSTRTDVVATFCDTVNAAGKKPMIYASQSWYQDNLQLSRLGSYSKWLANWNATVNWGYDFEVWQYTDSGKVNGISGNVDRNVWKI